MRAVCWSEEMALGVPAIDAAHKALLDALFFLSSAPDPQFAAGYFALVAQFERDFREEEDLMEKIRFPDRRGHREQHARVLNGLHDVDPYVTHGDFEPGREAIKQLPRWFLLHLSTMDLALAVALDLASVHRHPPPALLLRTELARLLNSNSMD